MALFSKIIAAIFIVSIGLGFASEPTTQKNWKEWTKSGHEKHYSQNQKGSAGMLPETTLVRIVNLPSLTGVAANTNADNGKEESEHWWEIPDWWIFAANVILIIVFWFHFRAFRSQANSLVTELGASDAKEQRELRAYVFRGDHPDHPIGIRNVATTPEGEEVTKAALSKPNIGPWVSGLMFHNSGKTPAYDVRIFGKVEIDSVKNPTKLNVDVLIAESLEAINKKTGFIGKSILPPNGWIGFAPGMKGALAFVEGWDESLWERQEIAIYVYGVVLYRDTFGKNWRYDFRLCHFNSGAEVLGVSEKIHACNEGDEEKEYTPA